MKNLLNPTWLILINTIPIGILIFIFWGEYNIIYTLLDIENIRLWKLFGSVLCTLGTFNLIYVIFLILKKRAVSPIYGLVALATYIPFLYLYGNFAEKIIPPSIPRWMVPSNMIIYVGTFLMPTLAYSLFILVVHFTLKNNESKAWKSFLAALSIPISWYLFSQIILPLWQPHSSGFETHVLIIFIIIGTLLFLFFLIRGVYILALKKSKLWKKYNLVWKIPISILFPLLGLAVNNGHLFNDYQISMSGIFGNFNNHWFYFLAIINGVFICLPSLKNKTYRLFLFIGRSITLAFTFYFFLVFLPYLPFSVLAIVAFGVGFLMLTPLVLFIIHIDELSKDYIFLKTYFSNKLLGSVTFISFMMIPLFITLSYINDKTVLNETLDYLYTPNYSKKYAIDKSSMSKTLAIIQQNKNNRWGGFSEGQTPYLSSYFNWLVLDNLTLSDTKIATINTIIFGNTKYKPRLENIQNKEVNISKISSNSRYDKKQNAWISWVDLEITNTNSTNGFSEYATTIELPVGCWISDYYLFVGDKKEMGILAEKKSAMWVFSQIRNGNKDPGILHYLSGNKVAFRVFPFVKKEIRKTGIEFIHKEPIQLEFDNHIITLGNTKEQNSPKVESDQTQNVIYVSAHEKTKLEKIQRSPYYHFLVDISNEKEALRDIFIQRIDQLLDKNNVNLKNAKISFVNTYTTTLEMDENWKDIFQKQKFEGGFYLDRAIKKTLYNSYKDNSKSYPLMVIVTDSIQEAILSSDYSDFKFAFPDTNLFYNLNTSGNLDSYSLLSTNTINADTLDLRLNQKVLAYPNSKNPIAYLPINNKASIVLKNEIFEVNDSQVVEKNWQSALTMQGKWISQILHPETTHKEWLNMVKYSFMSKIMTPLTSYLVVENEAQKAMLKKKQEQVLSGNKSLDLDEDTQRMTEPSVLIVVFLLGLTLWIKQKIYS